MRVESDVHLVRQTLRAVPEAPRQTSAAALLNRRARRSGGATVVGLTERQVDSRAAAEALIEHIFPTRIYEMAGVETAMTYAVPGCGNQIGGDIVDAFALANGAVTFTIADITGKGAAAAVNAALVKYAVRAYASEGFFPEKVLRSLNRLYIENNSHDRSESYLTAFFGLVDPSRRVLTYASAGHEPAVLCRQGQAPLVLPPTAPMIAVCNDSELPFAQASVPLQPRTVLVLTTDGVTETRSPEGEFFGIDRFRDCAWRNIDRSVEQQAQQLLHETQRFGQGHCDDDIAILVASFR